MWHSRCQPCMLRRSASGFHMIRAVPLHVVLRHFDSLCDCDCEHNHNFITWVQLLIHLVNRNDLYQSETPMCWICSGMS